nr:kunitz-type protease inhibitor 4 [Pogona vitticeps]
MKAPGLLLLLFLGLLAIWAELPPASGQSGKEGPTKRPTQGFPRFIDLTYIRNPCRNPNPSRSAPMAVSMSPECLQQICRLPKEVGPCLAAFSRWFYNGQTQKCEAFTYGGCQGNANNFKTLEECQKKCGSR